MYKYQSAKKVSVNIALLMAILFMLSNTSDIKYKLWDINNKLTWRDFKDTLVNDSHRAAATDAGIRVDFSQTSPGSLTINCYSVMFPAHSWVDSTKKSAYILTHEQYHFNIAEYWSRKMKKDMASTKFTIKNVKDKVSAIQKDDFRECHDMQVQYDAETKHSEIEPEQKRWEKKIDELLKSVEEYSASSIDVKLK